MARLRVLLWRILPLPEVVRWWLLRAFNTRYIVAASAVSFDGEGRLLLLRHTYRRRYPWGLPGGWLGGNETAEAGLAREIAEETGLQATIGSILLARGGHRPHMVELVFACTIGGDFRPSDEVVEASYFSYEDLPAGIGPEALPIITWAFAHRRAIRGETVR